MYRTGDLGQWSEEGRLEFAGRVDHQVKVRGFRIELGEIEGRLAEHDGVREAVVVVREDGTGDKRLVAYYTVHAERNRAVDVGGIPVEDLRDHVAAKLPDYMVPGAYMRMEKLPLNANGKVDRKALPAPDAEAYAMRGYEAPVGEIERVLAEIWAEVLMVERVGRHDNFFQLGGHSLLAVRIISHMRRAGLQGDVRALFVTPTLAELAAALGAPSTAIEVPQNRIPQTEEQSWPSSRVVELSL